MLTLVALVDQWRAIETGLPDASGDVRLRLIVDHEAEAGRAAALLGPANPGRHRSVIAFNVSRSGNGPSPELIRRLLARVDEAGIQGSLHLVRAAQPTAPTAVEERRRPTLAEQWGKAVAAMPDDWSDVYVELELFSSDYLERAALLLAPVNPARFGDELAYRFRVAHRFGYGASAEMAQRCFERLDAERIRGELRVLRVLSDTKPVHTQGPVWYVGGRAV
jgi:hypothetical protein